MSEQLQLVDSLIYRLDPGGVNYDEITVTMWGGSRNPQDRAQGARRVKACLEYCAGIPTEELEYVAGNDSDRCVGLIRQRWDAFHLHQKVERLTEENKRLHETVDDLLTRIG